MSKIKTISSCRAHSALRIWDLPDSDDRACPDVHGSSATSGGQRFVFV
ncbi:TPA: hypothetical protein ACKRFV_003077 [Proteus mirabilis]|nr:hypothetical protein [Proteus mirabilis]HEJ9684030.1 hypothetical protein [Proteus mirabilis]HEK1198329.1 hypothetical protein [Proteus mirabilis]